MTTLKLPEALWKSPVPDAIALCETERKKLRGTLVRCSLIALPILALPGAIYWYVMSDHKNFNELLSLTLWPLALFAVIFIILFKKFFSLYALPSDGWKGMAGIHIITSAIGIFIFMQLFHYSFEGRMQEYLPYYAMGLFAALIFIYLVYRPFLSRYSRYVALFKEKIMLPLVESLAPGARYDANAHIEEKDFDRSAIFARPRTRFAGDDLFAATLGKTAIRFCELNVSNSDAREKTADKRAFFHGIFLVADFNKHLNSRTLVLQKNDAKPWSLLDDGNSKTLCARVRKATMDSVDFEKAFGTWTLDDIEARYALTPAMMERLLKLQATSGSRLRAAYSESTLFLALDWHKRLFEPPFRATLASGRIVADWYYLLEDLFKIVEELDLNTRIWTKE